MKCSLLFLCPVKKKKYFNYLLCAEGFSEMDSTFILHTGGGDPFIFALAVIIIINFISFDAVMEWYWIVEFTTVLSSSSSCSFFLLVRFLFLITRIVQSGGIADVVGVYLDIYRGTNN